MRVTLVSRIPHSSAALLGNLEEAGSADSKTSLELIGLYTSKSYGAPPTCLINYVLTVLFTGRAVAYLVEALCYKPEGRWFDSR
jgi:hypothetical protein